MSAELIRLAALAIAAPGGPAAAEIVLDALRRAQVFDSERLRDYSPNNETRGARLSRRDESPPP